MKILRFSCGCSKYMRARTLNSDLTSLGLKDLKLKWRDIIHTHQEDAYNEKYKNQTEG